jgi:hypothetical protein
MKIKFPQQIIEKYSNVKIMKIWLLGAMLFHADGQMNTQTDRQTDTMRLTVTFHNFLNMPKN